MGNDEAVAFGKPSLCPPASSSAGANRQEIETRLAQMQTVRLPIWRELWYEPGSRRAVGTNPHTARRKHLERQPVRVRNRAQPHGLFSRGLGANGAFNWLFARTMAAIHRAVEDTDRSR